MGTERERVGFVKEVRVLLLLGHETSRALIGGIRMTHDTPPHFLDPHAILETFIALLGF